MKITKSLLFMLIGLPIFVCGQSQTPVPSTTPSDTTLVKKEYHIIDGDTLYVDDMDLEEVVLLGKLKFKDKLARRKYLILRRKTRKVYPYAKLAAERLTKLNDRLQKIKSRRQRKKYTKRLQKYMEGEFTEELKKMTRTEGQILVKLIHRQTGETMFSLIKEYRSGWRAFWYNTTASLFNISLKEKFNPMEVKEDYWIEDILQRSFQSGILEEQESALDFNFVDVRNKWLIPSQVKEEQ